MKSTDERIEVPSGKEERLTLRVLERLEMGRK